MANRNQNRRRNRQGPLVENDNPNNFDWNWNPSGLGDYSHNMGTNYDPGYESQNWHYNYPPGYQSGFAGGESGTRFGRPTDYDQGWEQNARDE